MKFIRPGEEQPQEINFEDSVSFPKDALESEERQLLGTMLVTFFSPAKNKLSLSLTYSFSLKHAQGFSNDKVFTQ